MNVCSSRTVPEMKSRSDYGCGRLIKHLVRLTVFCENRAWQQRSGQCPVIAKSGINVIFIHQDLLQVESKDVELVEVTRHHALQEIP